SREEGRMTVIGECAAPRKAAHYRLSRHDRPFQHEAMDHRFRGTTTRPWLDRGSHHRHRVSLGGGAPRALRRDCGRVCSSQRQRHVTTGPAAPQAKKATSVIPIVLALSGDPVGAGLVASLARPGGNITGLSMQWPDAAGKRLELLREVVPSFRRLAIMVNVGFPDAVLDASAAQAAAQSLGLEIATLEIRRAGDTVPAFESLKDHADALYVTADALLNSNRIRIDPLAPAAHPPPTHAYHETIQSTA